MCFFRPWWSQIVVDGTHEFYKETNNSNHRQWFYAQIHSRKAMFSSPCFQMKGFDWHWANSKHFPNGPDCSRSPLPHTPCWYWKEYSNACTEGVFCRENGLLTLSWCRNQAIVETPLAMWYDQSVVGLFAFCFLFALLVPTTELPNKHTESYSF